MNENKIRIKQYEQAADENVSIGGIKWQRKWDVCIQCDSLEQAREFSAELRRLDALNAELVEALKFIADHNLEGTDGSVAIIIAGMLIYHAKEALAKATGEQQ